MSKQTFLGLLASKSCLSERWGPFSRLTSSWFLPHHLLPTLIILLAVASPARAAIAPSQIALGSSQHVWLVDDADSKTLYRKNNATQRFDKVISNIKVDELDVSQDGVVFALSSDDLYVWSEADSKFIAHSSEQSFDQLSVGDNALWGVSSNNAYQWNTADNDFDKISSKIAFVAVGKQDDSVWAIDTDGELYSYDVVSESFTVLSSGGSHLTALYVLHSSSVWALNKQGEVLQWNSVEKQLVNISAQLKVSGLQSFAVDESDIFYAVNKSGLSFQNIARVQVDYSVASKVSRPVSAFAPDGTRHLIYNYNSAIYHAYVLPGTAESSKLWLGAQRILNSRTGSDLNLSVDDQGALHASWISGVGNAKEIHYALGQKGVASGGYGWSDPAQVSNDAVADSGLKMLLNPAGKPVFMTSKRDRDALHQEHDNYQHSLADDQLISFSDKYDLNKAYRDDMPFLQTPAPLQYILSSPEKASGTLGSDNTFTVIPPGHAFATKLVSGKNKSLMGFKVSEVPHGLKVNSYVKLQALLAPPSGPSVAVAVIVDYARTETTEVDERDGEKTGLTEEDVGIEMEVEVTFPIIAEALPEIIPLLTACEKIGAECEVDMLIDLGWTIVEFSQESESETSCTNVGPADSVRLTKTLSLDSSASSSFIYVADKSGVTPLPPGTAPADMRYHIDMVGFLEYIGKTVLSETVGLSTALNPEQDLSADLAFDTSGNYTQWSVGVALEAEAGYGKLGGIKGEFEIVATNKGLTSGTGELEENLVLKLRLWRLVTTLVSLSWSQPDSSTVNAYMPGGSSDVYGPGLFLGEGPASNTIDEGRIDAVVLNDGTVLGSFKQETGDADFEAVYIIDGTFNASTGSIDWDESSVKRLQGSGGFVGDPQITTFDASDKQNVLLAWLGVPAADADVQTLANTPAGKAYVIKPGDADIDLSTISQKTASADGDFYYSNDKALYGIGRSVAALGDVDGNGQNDFIVGAPDAETEEGRAYVVFGENYSAEIDTAIDDRQGAYGLALSGPVDSELGYAVSPAGDFNRDGKPDFVVGAPGSNESKGSAYIIYGGDTLATSTGIVDIDQGSLSGDTLNGGVASGQFGYSLAGGYDVSGDSFDDVIVGALGENAVYVYTSHSDAPWKLNLDAAKSNLSLGGDVASVGDVNGDGVADLLLGASGSAYLLYGGERLQDYVVNTVVTWEIAPTDGSDDLPYQVVLTFAGDDADNDGVLRGRATNPDSSIAGGYANELTDYRLEFFQAGKLVKTLGLADQMAIGQFNFNYAMADGQVLAKKDLTQGDGIFVGAADSWGVRTGEKPAANINKIAKWTTSDGYIVELDFAGSDDDGDGVIRGRSNTPQKLDDDYKNELTAWTLKFSQNGNLLYTIDLAVQQKRNSFNFNYNVLKNKIDDGVWTSATGFNAGRALGTNYNIYSSGGENIDVDSYVNGANGAKVLSEKSDFAVSSIVSGVTDSGIEMVLSDAGETLAEAALSNNHFTTLSTPSTLAVNNISRLPQSGIVFNNDASGFLHVSAAGDVNKDGIADMLLGTSDGQDFDYQAIPGRGYVVYGGNDLTSQAKLALENIEANSQGAFLPYGATVAAAGDVNGDKIDDIVVFEPSPAEGAASGIIYYGQANAAPVAGPNIGSASDAKELSGLSVASLGDLDGDGSTELLIGAPFGFDSDVMQRISDKAQIYQATIPLTAGSPYEVSQFPPTQTAGVNLQDVEATINGTVLTWIEEQVDPDTQQTDSSLFAAFMTNGAWGKSQIVRTSPARISGASLSDPSAASSSKKVTPGMLWQETNASGNSSLWQASYDSDAINWTVAQAQLQPSNTIATVSYTDSALSVGDSSYEVRDASTRETDGKAEIVVKRTGNLSKPSSVSYRTVDGSAQAGSDYKHKSGILHFGAGESVKKITISLMKDALPEKREQLFIELSHKAADAYRSWGDTRISGMAMTMGTLSVDDSDGDKVLELTAIDSGFIMSGEADSYLGGALSPAGDINADGWDDFLVGAPLADDNIGRAYLVRGKKQVEVLDMNVDLDAMGGSSVGIIFKGKDAASMAGIAVAGGKANTKAFVAVAQLGKVYLFNWSDLNGKTEISLDSTNTKLRVLEGDPSLDSSQFGTYMIVADVDGNKHDDLIIVDPLSESADGKHGKGRVYIVYDNYLESTQAGPLTAGTDVDVIYNSLGTGFGSAVAAGGDFNDDTYWDLILGSPDANSEIEAGCTASGSGGYIYAVWGKGPKGRFGTLDLNDLGGQGRIFAGIINYEEHDQKLQGDGDTGVPNNMPMVGTLLSDNVGNSAALLDFNGDGAADLVIGAPNGSPAGKDKVVMLEDMAAGRVYVLFGSSDWKNDTKPYPLASLYGDDFQKGLVFEGVVSSGNAGATVTNAGQFRGGKEGVGVEDILIGAPNVGNNAGQSYVVFGSTNAYDMKEKKQKDHPNIQWLSPLGDYAHPNVPLLFAFQGLVNAESTELVSGSLGATVSGAGDINKDGASDLLLAAPVLDLNGVSQLYVPIGHTWIQPGESLNVKHLRSDNGFVIENSGTPQGIGDFNGDGYDDFVIGGADPELVLGGNTLSNLNGVRQYPLSIGNDRFIITQALGNDYTLQIQVNGIDADGDGVLRGRGSDPTTISGGYGNEVTEWNLQITKNSKVVYNIDWATQQQRENFNFNLDLAGKTVIATAPWNTASGLNAGAVGPGFYNVYADVNLKVYQQNSETGQVYNIYDSVVDFETDSDPYPVLPVYRATWLGSNEYTLIIDFAGVDADGDGILRGRAKGNQWIQPLMPNELTLYTMRVYSPSDKLLDMWSFDGQLLGQHLDTTYSPPAKVAANGFNLNYNLKTNKFLDVEKADKSSMLESNSALLFGATMHWRGADYGKGPGVIYTLCGDCGDGSEAGKVSLSNNHLGIADTGFDPDFNIVKAPSLLTGPIVSGDFNGDGGKDFVVFKNLGVMSPASVASPDIASGLAAQTYMANSNPAAAIASARRTVVPLQYISKVDSGDINGDGYVDIVLSGYNANDDKGYLYAYYGSANGLDWDDPETLYAQGDDRVSYYLLSVIDLNNDGQDDIITYDLTMAENAPPLPYDYNFCESSKLGSLHTYGAASVGSTPVWQSIALMDSVFSADEYKDSTIDDICYLTAGEPADIDNDGLIDLIVHSRFEDGSEPEVSTILRSTGNFSFDDGYSKWSTVGFIHPDANYDSKLLTTQNPYIHSGITGINDFNHDGIDDVLMTNRGAVDNSGAVYNYVVYGSPDFWQDSGKVIELDSQDNDFDRGMAIKGFASIAKGYLGASAGDLNGDGFADIVMSNDDSGTTYGLYGYRTSHSDLTDYIVGSDTGEPLVQLSSDKNTVNVLAKSGDDTIQTARSMKDSLTPYKIVIDAGPGDDSIGISAVDSTLIHRIDGGHGTDTLKINPDFSGSANTLDLTLISRRIRNIEVIDLGDVNGLSFSYLDVRNMSGNKNTLMIKGTHSYAKAVDGERWRMLEGAAGQASHDNILYEVYRYVPVDDNGKELDSNIQVWIQQDGVTWRPFLN